MADKGRMTKSYGKIYGQRNIGNVRKNPKVFRSLQFVPSIPDCPNCQASSDSLQNMRLGRDWLQKYRCKKCGCIFKDFKHGRELRIYKEGKKQ